MLTGEVWDYWGMPNVATDVICPNCRFRHAWPRLYRLPEVAALTGMTMQTVRSWVNTGQLGSRLKFLGVRKAMRQYVDSYQLAEFLEKSFPVRSETAQDRTNVVFRKRRTVARKAQSIMIDNRRA